MIIFAWAHPADLHRASAFVKSRREQGAERQLCEQVRLYSTQEEAPYPLCGPNSLVRVQVRADWVGEEL